MERQAPLGSQFCKMSAFGVEVIVDFVSYLDFKGGGDKKKTQLDTRKMLHSLQ